MRGFILAVSVLASSLVCQAEGIKHMLSPGRISSDFLMTGTTSEFRNANYDVIGTTVSGGTKYFEFTPSSATFRQNVYVNGSDLTFAPLRPASRILENPPETIVTNLQSGHGYVLQDVAGTQTDDTSDFIKGTQSLKLVTDGAGSVIRTRLTSISPTIDMRGKFIKVWVKISSTTNTNDCWFYASSDNFVTYYTWKLDDDISQLSDDTWQAVTLSFGDAVLTGSPDRSAINAIQWRLVDQNSLAITGHWGGMSLIDEPQQGVVSLRFDDGWATQFTAAKKDMDIYGYVGTAYIIPNAVGTANYMTLAQLKTLQSIGWDIAAHHETNLTTLTAAQVEQTLVDIRTYLLQNGFTQGADHFAYPNGAYDETTVLPLIKKYFKSATTIRNMAESIPPGDPYKIRVLQVLNTVSTTTVNTAVLQAIANKEWLVMSLHKIVTGATVSTEYEASSFTALVQNLSLAGAMVKPVSEVIDGLSSHILKTDSGSNVHLNWNGVVQTTFTAASGNIDTAGALTVNGNITAGDSTSDTLIASGTITAANLTLASQGVISGSAFAVIPSSSITNDTTEETLFSTTINGNVLGANGCISTQGTVSTPGGSANSKTIKVYYGGSLLGSSAPTTTLTMQVSHLLCNKSATNSQIAGSSMIPGTNSTAARTASIDSTTAQTYKITATLAVATDTATWNAGFIEILK